MTISDRLDDLRKTISDCQLAAFGDAQARLILKASHAANVQREVLDTLCAEAARCFATAKNLSTSETTSDQCIILTTDDIRIYLRAQARPDFLCLVCKPECDPSQVVPIGLEFLARLSRQE